MNVKLFPCLAFAALLSFNAFAADPAPVAAVIGVYRLGPHLQNITKDGVTLIWETHQASVGAVEYGLNGAFDQKAQEDKAQTVHRVRITGLTAETTYNYRVTEGGETRESTFKTAPGKDRPITFVLIGDSRRWGTTWEDSKMQEHITQWDPEFYLTMGDLVLNGHQYELWPEHFKRFAGVMDHLWMVTARGNHEGSQVFDKEKDWFAAYHELPGEGEPFAGMEWGNTWIGLISYESTLAAPKWVDENAPKTDKKYKILAQHFPIYCAGYFGPEDSRKEMGTTAYKPLADCCDRNDIDLDLAGHTHIYERTFAIENGQRDDKNGTMYVINGGDINGNYPEWFTAVDDDNETTAKPTYTVFHMGEDQIWFRTFCWSKVEQKIVEIDYKIIPQADELPASTLAKLDKVSGADLLTIIENLGAMGYAPAAEALLPRLASTDKAEREAAATAIRRIGVAPVAEKLLAYLGDENEVVRRQAARAIEIAMPQSLVDPVAAALAKPELDEKVRQSLVGALELHAPAALVTEKLLAVLSARDTPEPLRQRASYTLARTATAQDVSKLADLFKNESSTYVTARLAFALNALTGTKQPIDGKSEIAKSKPGAERQAFVDKWLGAAPAAEKKAA